MSNKTNNFSFNKKINESKEDEKTEEKVEEKSSDDEIISDIDDEYSDADKFMYDYDSNENTNSLKSALDDKQKLLKVMLFVVGGGSLIILVIFVISLFTGNNYSFESLELIMSDAAKDYFNDNPNDLPLDENEISVIEVDTLVLGEYMKPLDSYTNRGVVCTGNIKVSKVEEEFFYKPFLDCGDDFISLSLYEKIESEPTVTDGYGLYNSGDIFSYRGEIVNNYIKLDNFLWRIVRVNVDNTVTLVLNNEFEYGGDWDNRYNTTTEYIDGINDYSISRIKEYADETFNNTGNEDSLLSENDKSSLVLFDVCTGKRDINSVGNDNSIECQTKLENQFLGFLTVSDFLNASSDQDCLKLNDEACQNYNYLVSDFDYWLVTADSNSTNKVYIVDERNIELVNANSYSDYRFTITLGSDVMYKSGDGTIDNPYTLR